MHVKIPLIAAIAMGIFGVALSAIAVLVPDTSLLAAGLPLVMVSGIYFQIARYHAWRRTNATESKATFFFRSLSFSPKNPVANFAYSHPWLLVAWFNFIFVLVVVFGILAELDRRIADGALLLTFAVIAAVAAATVFVNRRNLPTRKR